MGFLILKEKVQDEKTRKIKKSVKERFAYLLNVYQHRGKYNEEFGLNLYTEDLLLEDDCRTLLGVAENADMKDKSVEEVINGDASAENTKDEKDKEDEIEEVTLDDDSDSDTEASKAQDKKTTSADEDDSDEAEDEDSTPKKSKGSKPKSKVEQEASADEESGEDDEESA